MIELIRKLRYLDFQSCVLITRSSLPLYFPLWLLSSYQYLLIFPPPPKKKKNCWIFENTSIQVLLIFMFLGSRNFFQRKQMGPHTRARVRSAACLGRGQYSQIVAFHFPPDSSPSACPRLSHQSNVGARPQRAGSWQLRSSLLLQKAAPATVSTEHPSSPPIALYFQLLLIFPFSFFLNKSQEINETNN